jgi:hypothetical protein
MDLRGEKDSCFFMRALFIARQTMQEVYAFWWHMKKNTNQKFDFIFEKILIL